MQVSKINQTDRICFHNAKFAEFLLLGNGIAIEPTLTITNEERELIDLLLSFRKLYNFYTGLIIVVR